MTCQSSVNRPSNAAIGGMLNQGFRMPPLVKSALVFVVFAVVAAILNAIFFPGPLGSPYAEGVGKAVACWCLAYLITWTAHKNRSTWLFGVSILILIFALFIQPGLIESLAKSG